LRPAPLSLWNRGLVRLIRTGNRVAGRPIRHHPDLARALHNVTFARVARAAIGQAKPDFIYERYSLWSRAGLSLAKRYRVPLVLEVNAPLVYEQQKYRSLCLPSVAARVERTIWRNADLLIAVSGPLRNYIEGEGIPGDRIVVMPNGVEPDRFLLDEERAAERARLNLAGRYVIGMVATFKPWHGTDVLLSAFELLHRSDPSAHLLLVGDGPDRAQLEDQVRTAGLQDAVTFTGTVPHRDVPRHLIAMDVAVVPYPEIEQNYYSPLKLFEYMAAGRPIVASRMGQVADILADGDTGLLFHPGNAEELSDCLRRIRQSADLGRELGRKAREACRKYTWDNNAARLMEHVRPLLRRGSNSVLYKEEHRVV